MPGFRVAVGGLFHESNTFVRPLTTRADYETTRLYRGAEMLAPLRGTDTETGGFLQAAVDCGFEIIPTLLGWAWPGGPLTDECFDSLLEELKQSMEACQPVDGVLLQVHGAMVTESNDDPDGTILAEVRACLPPGVPLVATFDMHANLSPLMVTSCDALIGYNTYPHVDLFDCGREAGGLLASILREEIQPRMALAKPPLMPHIIRQRTADGPMARMMELARMAEEDPRVLRVSIAPGFPYADVPRMGMGVLVVTDADEDLAAQLAADLADAAWSRRSEFTVSLPDAHTAVAQAVAMPGDGPVVLSDVADNVGGGSPGDGTFLLRELIDAGAAGSLVMLTDPESVAACIHVGVRSELDLRVGGKADRQHGEPVAVRGRVRAVADGVFRNRGPMRDGLVDDMGRTVVLDLLGQARGVTLVLTERKLPQWNLEQFRSLGIEPTRCRVVVCKGAVAHRAAYVPIARSIIDVETPGSCAGDVRSFTYEHIRRPLYPLDGFPDT